MHLQLALILALSLLASQVYGDGFGSIIAEKNSLLKRIQCSRQSTTPVGDGLGSLWGCYNRTEDVKLWINEQVSNRNTVKNVKLMAVSTMVQRWISLAAFGAALLRKIMVVPTQIK